MPDSMTTLDAATIFRANNLSIVPIVNEEELLLGQLNSEDIMNITQTDSDNTLLNMQGLSDDEELFAPIIKSSRSRGVWLGINLATAFLAAYVIG